MQILHDSYGACATQPGVSLKVATFNPRRLACTPPALEVQQLHKGGCYSQYCRRAPVTPLDAIPCSPDCCDLSPPPGAHPAIYLNGMGNHAPPCNESNFIMDQPVKPTTRTFPATRSPVAPTPTPTPTAPPIRVAAPTSKPAPAPTATPARPAQAIPPASATPLARTGQPAPIAPTASPVRPAATVKPWGKGA